MGIPDVVIKLYEKKAYPELIWYFRHKWDHSSWLYLKKNCNAVERVKQEFTRITGADPFPAGETEHWNKQVAKFVDALGVKVLINDMRAACKEKKNIRSILYFVYSSTGACRWENLLMQHIEERWQKKKQQHAKDNAELAKKMDVKMKSMEPEWVVKARQNYLALQYKLLHTGGGEHRNRIVAEMTAIAKRLKNSGYEL